MRICFALVLFVSALQLGAVGAELNVVPNPLPGVYAETITVSLPKVADLTVKYRFLESPAEVYLPWTDSLLLSALPGESRPYTLRLQSTNAAGESLTKDYRYSIVRTVAMLPSVTPSPGLYTRPLSVEASLPEGTRAWLDGKAVSFPLSLPGVIGEQVTYRLDLKALSAKEPTYSPWLFVVDLRGQSAVSLEVLSPVPGNWANRQSLALSFQGLERVFWCWGSQVDQNNAIEYRNPVTLGRTGSLALTVWGTAKGSGALQAKTVNWSNGDLTFEGSGFPEPGVTLQPLTFAAHPDWDWSLDEGRTWRPLDASRVEPTLSQNLKVLTVQGRDPAKNGVWRGLYWMDTRQASQPLVEYWGGWNPRVSFNGAAEAWYTAEWKSSEGKTSSSEALWGPSGSWKIPDGIVSTTITCHLLNGQTAVSAIREFPESGWIRPVWEPWNNGGVMNSKGDLPLGGRLIPRPGFQAVYEIGSERDLPEPGRRSALLAGPLFPQVPLGADRIFYVRFAWRDDSGAVGPPTSAIPLRVDHLPPSVPQVVISGTRLELKSEDTDPGTVLTYAVSKDSVRDTEGLVFRAWKPAEATAIASEGAIWLHARAQDAAGNQSSPLLNWPLGEATATDWRGLVMGGYLVASRQALADNSVLPLTRVSLQPAVGPETGWYAMVTDDSELPGTWGSSLLALSGPLVIGIKPGERRTVYTWWNWKSGGKWLWDQPRKVGLTLDQGPPGLPKVSASTLQTVVREAWTLAALPSQTGDKLTYTLTKDGSAPPSPLDRQALAWQGPLVLDVPEGQKATFRWRLGVTSVSGQSREWPEAGTIIVDKTTPSAVFPGLEFFSYHTRALKVPIQSETPLRYSVTLDGSTPGVPDLGSAKVTGGVLEFPGTPGKQSLYRFRLRPYSLAGTPGPATDVYSILIDLTVPSSDSRLSTVSGTFDIQGLPEGGLSAKPIQLKLKAPWGQPRYELVEGDATVHPVENNSTDFPEALNLDGVDGADRRYTLAVRSFSAEGRPLTPEARWSIRIDRSAPSAPNLDLMADTSNPIALIKGSKISTSNEETLEIRLQWASFPTGDGTTDWTSAPNAELRFVAPGGRLTRLTAEARVRDTAGNLSPIVKKSLVIDRNVVYASSKAPAGGDGSRENPFSTLSLAVAKMRSEGRKILLLVQGNYLVDTPQDWTNLTVWGGLAEGLWDQTVSRGRSVVSAGKGFVGKSLLEVSEGTLELHQLDLANAGEKLELLVNSSKTRVVLDQTDWQSQGTPVGWRQSQGSLEISGMTALWVSSLQSELFDLSGVDFRVNGARWTVQDCQDSRLVALTGSRAFLADISVATRKETGLDTFLWAKDSTVSGSKLKILVGDNATSATGFVFQGSSVVLSGVELSLYAGRANTGFQIISSDVDLQKVNLAILKGVEFNQGLRLQDSKVRLSESAVKVDGGSYQGGLSQNGGTLDFKTSSVTLGGGGLQAFGLQTLGACANHLTDLTWILGTKTVGKAIMKGADWATDSWEKNSTSTGW
jgi:hypothetical protein